METNGNKFNIDPNLAFLKRDRRFLALMKRVMDRHYVDQEFNIQKLSAALGVSERQTERKTKTLLACSPSEYLRAYRLQKSLFLLAKGIPVKEVAQAVGFSSQSYFATCFRSQFHSTPTEYQKGCSVEP